MRSPEDYVPRVAEAPADDAMSDSGSWGSDFDDHEDPKEQVRGTPSTPTENTTNFRNSLAKFELNGKAPSRKISLKNLKSPETPESIYMNCPSEDEDMTYINVKPRTVGQLPIQIETSLAEKLKEELKLIIQKDDPPTKPEIAPRPVIESLTPSKRPQLTSPRFKQISKNPAPPPLTKKFPKIYDRSEDLPRPPKMLRNFDLVANLPTKTEESDDDYEAIDGQVALQHQQKFGSKQSMLGSVESVYKPSSSTTSQEKEDDFYECITESVE